MTTRHPKPRPKPLPCHWLMTDERMGDALWDALRVLPRGSGVVFRHHATPPAARSALFARVARIARARRLILLRTGTDRLGRADGVHGAGRFPPDRIRTWPAHSRREALAGVRAGADLLFVSPIFATRSHPGARPLGAGKAAAIARGLRIPAIALGGMDTRRFRRLAGLGFHGWAAIDAWTAPRIDQKRKAVPI